LDYVGFLHRGGRREEFRESVNIISALFLIDLSQLPILGLKKRKLVIIK